MAAKTSKNDDSVEDFISGITDEQRRGDCTEVLAIMTSIIGEEAKMWGKNIVGLGSMRYQGKTTGGEWFRVGFSPRKQNLVLYLYCELEKQAALLEKLGKHKIGKSCLYLNKLADVHLPTLKKLIKKAYQNPAMAGAEIILD